VSEYEMETRLEEMDRLHQDAMRRASQELEKVKSERDLLAHVLTALRLWMGEYPTDKYTGEWWQRELDRLTSAGKVAFDNLKSERDRLADELVRVKQAATWDWHDTCQKAYAATGSHGHGPEHVIDAVEVLRQERDRLAAEVERLAALEHGCPNTRGA